MELVSIKILKRIIELGFPIQNHDRTFQEVLDWLRDNHQVLVYNTYKEFGQMKFPKQFVCKIEWANGGWDGIHGTESVGYYQLLEQGIERALERIK